MYSQRCSIDCFKPTLLSFFSWQKPKPLPPEPAPEPAPEPLVLNSELQYAVPEPAEVNCLQVLEGGYIWGGAEDLYLWDSRG
jgi:hypothetical protein